MTDGRCRARAVRRMLDRMRRRELIGAVLVTGFVAVVAHAAAAHQHRDGELGACARVHLELMRKPSLGAVLLVAEPMRAAAERG